jgi:putative oxidoreductase
MTDHRTAPYAALLLRITLGSLFILHLYWKFEIRGFDRWWTSFQNDGYPAPLMIYVLLAEFAGALLLIPGILTRWVSLFALPVMFGAAYFWFTGRDISLLPLAQSFPSCGGSPWSFRRY